jgi:hypothetical protein
MRRASVSGKRNVLVQVCPCHNETTTMPSEGWVDKLILSDGDLLPPRDVAHHRSDRRCRVPQIRLGAPFREQEWR